MLPMISCFEFRPAWFNSCLYQRCIVLARLMPLAGDMRSNKRNKVFMSARVKFLITIACKILLNQSCSPTPHITERRWLSRYVLSM